MALFAPELRKGNDLSKRQRLQQMRRRGLLDKMKGPRGGRWRQTFPATDEALAISRNRVMLVGGDDAVLIRRIN